LPESVDSSDPFEQRNLFSQIIANLHGKSHAFLITDNRCSIPIQQQRALMRPGLKKIFKRETIRKRQQSIDILPAHNEFEHAKQHCPNNHRIFSLVTP
jgi:hypothetical protein